MFAEFCRSQARSPTCDKATLSGALSYSHFLTLCYEASEEFRCACTALGGLLDGHMVVVCHRKITRQGWTATHTTSTCSRPARMWRHAHRGCACAIVMAATTSCLRSGSPTAPSSFPLASPSRCGTSAVHTRSLMLHLLAMLSGHVQAPCMDRLQTQVPF